MTQVSRDDACKVLWERVGFGVLCLAHTVLPFGGFVAACLPLSKYESALLNTAHILRACDNTYTQPLRKDSHWSQLSHTNDTNDSGFPVCFEHLEQEIRALHDRQYHKSYEAGRCYEAFVRRYDEARKSNDDNTLTVFAHYRCYFISQLNLELFRSNPTFYEQPYKSYRSYLFPSTAVLSPLIVVGVSRSYFGEFPQDQKIDIRRPFDVVRNIWRHAVYYGYYRPRATRFPRTFLGLYLVANGALLRQYINNTVVPIHK